MLRVMIKCIHLTILCHNTIELYLNIFIHIFFYIFIADGPPALPW